MTTTNTYNVKRTGVEVVDRNFDDIWHALELIVKSILNIQIVTFVTHGAASPGAVPLIPPKAPNSTTPLYRGLAGFKVIGCVDLTSGTNAITWFELVLSQNDQIKQLINTNLSAHNMLFILQG